MPESTAVTLKLSVTTGSTRLIEPPTDNKTGSTTRRSAGLDAAAPGAAAVRSEAEDERRSREQSVRARHSNLIEVTN
jgi:hypothetical protein